MSSVYCGDAIGRVRIDANNLIISFPYHPVEPLDYNHLCRGIENDILHFRFMVAKTMISELMTSENELVPLTIDFPLFFSKIYTSGIANEDLDIVKEMGFFQIFHPLFFDSVDRNNFIHLVLEYQNRNFHTFNSRLTLDDSSYKLRGWTKTIPHDSDFHWMVDIASKHSGKYYFSIIPWLMLNARHHFSEKTRYFFFLLLFFSIEKIENLISNNAFFLLLFNVRKHFMKMLMKSLTSNFLEFVQSYKMQC